MRALGIPSKNEVHVLLVDRQGSILWRTTGRFDEAKGNALAGAIERLPERERIVIGLYYYEGLTLKEIGEGLGVTESRVSQLHTKAVLRLRGRIKEDLDLDPLTA